MFFSYNDLPPEVQRMIDHNVRMEELQEMDNDAKRQEITNLIDFLPPEHLVTLRGLLINTSRNSGAAEHFIGMIAGALVFKHNLGWDGEDPEAILKEAAQSAESKASLEVPPVTPWERDVQENNPLANGTFDEWIKQSEQIAEGKRTAFTEELRQAMFEAQSHRDVFSCNVPGYKEKVEIAILSDFAIEELREEYRLTVEDGRLVCRDCHIGYVTLTDRMLKPADLGGCHGCIEKSKHG